MNGFVMVVALLHGASGGSDSPRSYAPGKVWPDDKLPLPLLPSLQQKSEPVRFAFRFGEQWGPVLALPIMETEVWRCQWVVGNRSFALLNEWYLGHGVGGGVAVEARFHRLAVPITLFWYPIEGIEVSVGLDSFRWRLIGSVSLMP